MKANIKQLFIFLIIFSSFLTISLELLAKEKDTSLLLAKSLVGECGVDCSEKEMNIIYNIYKKRQGINSWSLHKVISKYSGAIKKRKNHPNKFILFLNREGDKPKHWDSRLSWKKYKIKWLEMLSSVDEMMNNNTPDLCVECQHFCGKFELHIVHWTLKRVDLNLRNAYFRKKNFK